MAAIYQSSGLFVERDVTQREEVDLLQLDVITTDYDQKHPALQLVEAKSGNWGFADIFKIRGWMGHVDVGASTLITLKLTFTRRGAAQAARGDRRGHLAYGAVHPGLITARNLFK